MLRDNRSITATGGETLQALSRYFWKLLAQDFAIQLGFLAGSASLDVLMVRAQADPCGNPSWFIAP
jgi:hypothetical protein